MCMERINLTVKGHVQGVGFRFFVSRTANSLGLKGFVRNLSDGSVEIIAEGEKAMLERLLYLVRDGPITAQIDCVDAQWEKAKDEFQGFGIRY